MFLHYVALVDKMKRQHISYPNQNENCQHKQKKKNQNIKTRTQHNNKLKFHPICFVTCVTNS